MSDFQSLRRRELDAVYVGHFRDAALAALEMADDPNCHPDAGKYHVARAQVYATLHQAEMALWIAENRQWVPPHA